MKLNALDYLGISDYFSEEEIMVQNTARTFVEKEVMPIIEDFYKKGEFPEHLISKFAELGFFGVNIPEKYGDPALLTPLLYKSSNIKKYKIGVIPHTVDYKELKQKFNDTDICVINLYINNDEYSIKKVIDDINKCKFIFSSSLHGIILSNAYNVPVVKFRHNKLAGDDIKFIDYFESVYSNKYYCNTNLDIDYCINNFKNVKNYYTKPDLIKKRQKDLIDTCPFFDKTLSHLLLKD